MRKLRVALAGTLLIAARLAAQTPARLPGELAWALRSEPKTFDPAKVDEQASENIRLLTAGVLLRLNRETQQMQPELAESWTESADGRVLRFRLRAGLRFSDGSPLSSSDAAFSLRRVLAPATGAPVAEEFVSPLGVTVETPDPLTLVMHLPRRVVAVEKVFAEVAIEPVNKPSEARVTAGPFTVGEYARGQYVRLRRNPNYWRRDAAGTQLPYASGIRLDIVGNREQEVARFERGGYDLIENLQPDYFALLAKADVRAARDLGPSLNSEQMWFNQAAGAPLPEYEKAWFRERAFRVAVSEAIHRADLARIAYEGHATAAYGWVSPANTLWVNRSLEHPREDLAEAQRTLAGAGFRRQGQALVDAGGHPVKFSLLTNAGNSPRLKMATLIQQDLRALGMEVNIVTLDFPALVERLLHTQDYEACLLGLTNVDPDPNSMLNLWVSSSPNHQWNPGEKTPATVWEAEIDKLMAAQASASEPGARKRDIDRVQQIVADQQPFVYLVYPNALYAVAPQLTGVRPTVYEPQLIWNAAEIRRQEGGR